MYFRNSKLIQFLLIIVYYSCALAHEYEHPAIFDVDQNWQLHRGELAESHPDLISGPWQKVNYTDEVMLPRDLNPGEIIWLKAQLPSQDIVDPILLFEEMMTDYQVYFNDSLVFFTGNIEKDQKHNFHGDSRQLVSLGDHIRGGDIYFRIKVNEDPMQRNLSKVHIGKHSDFMDSFLDTDLKYVVLGFFFILSSIIPLATYIKFRRSKENAALSLLTFSFGILTLSESVFFGQWLGSDEAFLYVVEPASFLASISLCLYFEAIFGSGWRSNLKILRNINFFILLIIFPLLILFQPHVIYWLNIKIVFFALLMLILLSTFIYGSILAKKGDKAARTIMIGYSALSIFGLLDILGGVFELFPWSPGWYPWGILILVLVLQYNTQYRLKKYSSDLENSHSQLIESRFETLKNQINPHFLFNSLNTLSSLIFIDREQAATFVRDLSKVYRFILETRDKERIALDEELKILEAYIYLVQTRFKESLQINLQKSAHQKAKEIAPLCLQMLIENAIKHNVTSKGKPLIIDIFLESDAYIVVQNNLQPKSTMEFSSKIGLKNITSRYAYLTKLPVIIEESKDKFIVKIPLL
jgi:sensor histidine kinase YesM